MDLSSLSNEQLLSMRQKPASPSTVAPPAATGLSALSDSALLAMRKPQAAPPAPMTPPQQPGFMARVGQNVQKRVGMAEDIKARAGAAPIGETALQAVGGVGAGLLADVAGEVATSAYGALPESVRQNIEADPITKMGVRMAQKGAEVYGKWAQQNPRAAKNVEATVNIGALFPIGKVAGVAAKAAGEATTLGPIAKGMMAPSPEKIKATALVEKKGASAKAEAAKESGVVYDASTLEGLFADMRGAKNLQTPGERRLAGKTMALIDDLETKTLGPMVKDKATGEMVRDITKAEPGSDTLRSLFATSKELDAIARRGGDDKIAALQAKESLLDAMEKGNIVSGDRDAAMKLVKEYKQEHGQAKFQEELAGALEGKSAKEIKNKMGDILESPFFKTYPKEVQNLIKLAAKGKVAGNVLDAIGRLRTLAGGGRLTGTAGVVMSALMGHPGPAVAAGTIVGAGAAARQIAKGTVSDVLKASRKKK